MLSRVIAKNVRDVFFETHLSNNSNNNNNNNNALVIQQVT